MSVTHILTIAGSDSGGGAGIQADIKTVTALGGFGMSVVTALTAQNTLGVQGIHEVPLHFVEMQFDSVLSDIRVDCAKTGMIGATDMMRLVGRKIEEYDIHNLVVDPVMTAKGGASLIHEDAVGACVECLLSRARLATPNIPEAEILTGGEIRTPDDMKEAARAISKTGARSVLLKGGHLGGSALTEGSVPDGQVLDVLFDEGRMHEFSSERIKTKNTHGTGCTLSAAIATGLGKGMSVFEAVAEAKKYMDTAIRFSLGVGSGHGPVNHMAAVFRESRRYETISELRNAVRTLKEGGIGRLIPEIQSNLVYALPHARCPDEVAGIPGRIIRVGDDIETLHDPAFGASSHVARIVLTVMKYDEEYRSAMALKFSEQLVNACRDLGFDTACFSRKDEPPEVKEREGSSLEWGTDSVLAGRESIPDIIFDRGDVGKEPAVRVLGKTPGDVSAKVLKIAEKSEQ